MVCAQREATIHHYTDKASHQDWLAFLQETTAASLYYPSTYDEACETHPAQCFICLYAGLVFFVVETLWVH